jgi:hypothetical protein
LKTVYIFIFAPGAEDKLDVEGEVERGGVGPEGGKEVEAGTGLGEQEAPAAASPTAPPHL